jgi:hypothetical protein
MERKGNKEPAVFRAPGEMARTKDDDDDEEDWV